MKARDEGQGWNYRAHNYSLGFRKESVKFFKESGLTLAEAAKRLLLPKGTANSSTHPKESEYYGLFRLD